MATDKGTNIVQNICLTEQPFLSKSTIDFLWNFSFLKVCIHLIFNFTYKDKIFKRISSSCYRIFLNWTSCTSVLKKGVFEILKKLMLYFIAIRAWIENIHIKSCIKNLMVIMPRYFYKAIKDKTWKSSVKKAILVTSQTCKLYSTFYWFFYWVRVRKSVEWSLFKILNFIKILYLNLKNKNQIWKPKIKI